MNELGLREENTGGVILLMSALLEVSHFSVFMLHANETLGMCDRLLLWVRAGDKWCQALGYQERKGKGPNLSVCLGASAPQAVPWEPWPRASLWLGLGNTVPTAFGLPQLPADFHSHSQHHGLRLNEMLSF